MKPELVLLVGNIGSGKSTKAKEYAKEGYLIVCRDSLRTMLGAGDYIFSHQTEVFINNAYLVLIQDLILSGRDFVIDQTNISRDLRSSLIRLGKRNDYHVVAHVMPQIGKEKCVENRTKDTLRGMTKEKWEKIWCNFERRYEKPTLAEGFDEIRT